jgi:PASTA domain/Regulator of chromosome condensation (RCC1) repeat
MLTWGQRSPKGRLMRHPSRFLSPALALFLLAATAVILCAGSTAGSFKRSLGAAATGGVGHTCVLTRAGGVQCWGYNGHDELGTGGNDLPSSLTPVSVDGMASGVTAIYAGIRHSCAVTSPGGAKCWGANYEGALGDGTADRHYSPVAVLGLSSGVTGVSAGHDYSCALVMGGVKCWGESYEPTPIDIPGLGSGVTQISSGTRDSCALTQVGGVKCWGGHYGPTPVEIPGLSSGVTALATGSPFCVLTSGAGVKCWGADTNWAPVDVPGLGGGITALASKGGHTCALGGSGGVKCWGSNEFGQLGDGTTIDRTTPVDVVGLTSGVAAIGLGFFHSCAITRAGGVKCWGLDEQGKKRLRPIEVVGFGPPPLQCVVPSVVGKRLAKARARIAQAHCRVGRVTRIASRKSRNLVVRQSPRPGKRLQAGSRISLSVSR